MDDMLVRDSNERIERIESKPTPRFETADAVWNYLASRGETYDDHEHLWVAWDAWDDWSWNPHMKRSVLFVCDVPDCLAVRTERVRFAAPDRPERDGLCSDPERHEQWADGDFRLCGCP